MGRGTRPDVTRGVRPSAAGRARVLSDPIGRRGEACLAPTANQQHGPTVGVSHERTEPAARPTRLADCPHPSAVVESTRAGGCPPPVPSCPQESSPCRLSARRRHSASPAPSRSRSSSRPGRRPGTGHPGHRAEDRRAPRADDARREDRAAQPVHERVRRDRPAAERGRAEGEYDQIRRGWSAPMLNVTGAEATGKAQQPRGREQPAEDPDDLRTRRDPRLQDDVPRPARRSGQLGLRRGRDVRAHGGDRSGRRGPPLDVRADGRHRARRALGPDHGGLRRGLVPRRADRRPHACAASRARTSRRSTRLPPAPSTTRPTASPRPAATTTRSTSRRARSVTSCCRHSRRRPTPAPRRS